MTMAASPVQARHIAIVMHDFSTGGSERIAIRLANQWAREGRRVTILCGVVDGPVRSLIAPEVTIVTVWPEIRRSIFSRLMLGFALADCVATLEPDILFSPGNFHIPVFAALGLKMGKRRPPFVCKLSNPLQISIDRTAQNLFSRVMRWSTGTIDVFVAMSRSLRDEAASVLPGAVIRVISEPNIDSGEPVERVLRHPKEPALIVCAGRLAAQKNFALALRAFALVAPAANARLLILGEGDQRAVLEKEAERLKLGSRVRFAGHIPDIRPDLANASLFLLSSRYEGYPAVLIEALAAGLPVITTDCSPAIAEIMCHPSFGRIVPSQPQHMADAIGDMLQMAAPDHEQVKALVKRHRIDVVADQYMDLFDGISTTRKPVPQGVPAQAKGFANRTTRPSTTA
jgi:glycosyltransferase involved in cell wall biosynthesis